MDRRETFAPHRTYGGKTRDLAMDSDLLTFFGVMLSLAVAAGVAVTLIGLGQALTRRVARSSRGRAEAPDLEALSELAVAMDDLRERVAELENRVEFSERLLTRPSGEARALRLPDA